jgi:hypothetical protein
MMPLDFGLFALLAASFCISTLAHTLFHEISCFMGLSTTHRKLPVSIDSLAPYEKLS